MLPAKKITRENSVKLGKRNIKVVLGRKQSLWWLSLNRINSVKKNSVKLGKTRYETIGARQPKPKVEKKELG